MSKNIQFAFSKSRWAAAITKVDRDKVYGFVEEKVTDSNGDPCVLAGLLDDGQTIVLPGATALKTVDGNYNEVDKKTLKTVYQDGTDAVLVPSSYEGEVNLQSATIDELLDLEVTTVYQLFFETPEEKSIAQGALKKEPVLRFVFNYRADYEGADAFVVSAQDEVFILTGRKLEFQFLKNEQVPLVQSAEETEEDMDFGML
jgi:hypothetical protein